ncbi:MAG TPA: 1,4-alpha-glucan branching protein domain-containing protein [Edaphobacter sp.]|nr:1,4-alpha-glucan branching protein domain-containing protein [Edaphobacter sp.]
MTNATPKASASANKGPGGFLTFTLHAHLPYVVNHGTWPHGMEWLHEAAAETYLPLLRMLKNLERDKIRFNCNLNLSPILLEQLSHPVFIAEFPRYLGRKIVAAQEDEAFFTQTGEAHYAETARFWHRFFSQALEDFNHFDQSIIKGFRHFNDIGLIDIITCGATHGYMPLLGTDESVRAQIRTAVSTHIRHIGEHPRGIWAPECGYRPAGFWNYPVGNADGSPTPPGFDRIGVEQALSESEIEFFFVDTHLVEESHRVPSPYELLNGGVPVDEISEQMTHRDYRRLYQPYYVDGPYDKRYATTIFPRDPRTGVQVWSGDSGYPGDGTYLDFHKKRWPGGHRYWRVTGSKVDMGDKQPYYPKEAAERVKSHAANYVHLVWEALQSGFNDSIPPILCSPFDAELFGHWWFEGVLWLEAVARTLHDYDTGIQLISCAEYLDRFPRAGFIAMHEGSWGAEGNNHVWMNPETSWTYTHIYPAELYTREVCTAGGWRDSALGKRIVQQLCRELLLLESSDWQFLITTGAARDYAEIRFLTHNDQFNEIKAIWQAFDSTGTLTATQETRLAEIERRDSVFPDIEPGLWVAGAHQSRDAGPTKIPAEATTATLAYRQIV